MSSIHWIINAQYSKGGPIIAVQVENEYGSYAKDQEYMPFIKEVRNRFVHSFQTVIDNSQIRGHLFTLFSLLSLARSFSFFLFLSKKKNQQ